MAELIGRTVGGYRVEAELGRGGQAIVYRATQMSLQRVVALKVVSPQYASDEGFMERFKREGISAASLDHPNVVPVYEAGESDGVAYLAMKYIDGGSLDDLLRRGGSIPLPRALSILRQIAEALDYAAGRGFIHRDVKPANVLLGPGDHVYLTDFGLARALEGSRITRTGVWMGTLEYIAPEQIRGSEVTPAADRYAFAVVAYEMLTGRPPFQREDRTALLYAHLSDTPEPPSTLRPELGGGVDAVLARALAKDPDQRYPSAGAFVEALAQAIPTGAGAAPTLVPGAAATEVTPAVTAGPPSTDPPQPPPPATPPPLAAPAGAAPAYGAQAAAPPPGGDPPKRRRGWLPWALGGGGAVVVAGVVVAVVLATSGGGGGNTITTFVTRSTESIPTISTDTTTTTTTTAGPAFPTARERVLISHLPRAVRASCERTDEAAQAPKSITSVYCRLRGRGIYYEQFSGTAPMQAYYEGKLRLHDIKRDSGSCESKEDSEGTYNQGGATVGRITCYRVSGTPWIVWTHTKLRVVSTLLGSSDTPKQIYDVWKDAGPFA
jgi:predicted Ser/Thr protein kinase